MEYENHQQKENFDFLEDGFVQKHFANTNSLLLSGKHIQNDDIYEFDLLQNNKQELQYYYQKIYDLVLCWDKRDDDTYYYLSFPEQSRGKLSNLKRYRDLTEEEVIVGIILMNWYYELYFEKNKTINWRDIKNKIMQSDLSDQFRLLFFDTLDREYTDKEWGEDEKPGSQSVKARFRRTLNSFSRLGWISWKDKENIEFEIKSSIHRFVEKLYPNEIIDFENFIKQYNKDN